MNYRLTMDDFKNYERRPFDFMSIWDNQIYTDETYKNRIDRLAFATRVLLYGALHLNNIRRLTKDEYQMCVFSILSIFNEENKLIYSVYFENEENSDDYAKDIINELYYMMEWIINKLLHLVLHKLHEPDFISDLTKLNNDVNDFILNIAKDRNKKPSSSTNGNYMYELLYIHSYFGIAGYYIASITKILFAEINYIHFNEEINKEFVYSNQDLEDVSDTIMSNNIVVMEVSI